MIEEREVKKATLPLLHKRYPRREPFISADPGLKGAWIYWYPESDGRFWTATAYQPDIAPASEGWTPRLCVMEDQHVKINRRTAITLARRSGIWIGQMGFRSVAYMHPASWQAWAQRAIGKPKGVSGKDAAQRLLSKHSLWPSQRNRHPAIEPDGIADAMMMGLYWLTEVWDYDQDALLSGVLLRGGHDGPGSAQFPRVDAGAAPDAGAGGLR